MNQKINNSVNTAECRCSQGSQNNEQNAAKVNPGTVLEQIEAGDYREQINVEPDK